MVLGASAVGLLSGFFFGGSIGVAVFFALIGVLWMVVSMVLSVVKAFVNGYLIVCVMLIIAPFFMPLIFLKVTSEYFEKWWKAILGGILLPIIITAYSMFALQVYDAILFEKDSLLQTLFDEPLIKEAREQPTAPCDFNVTNDPAFKQAAGNPSQSEMDKIMKNPFIQNYVMPALSGGNNACGIFTAPVLKLTNIKKQEFQDAKKAMNEIFIKSLQLFIMAFLIGAGVHTMEGNIATLAAGSGMAARAMSAKSQVEKNLAEGVADVKSSLARSFDDGRANDDPKKKRSGVSGSDFVNGISGAGKSAAGSFLGQVLGNKRG
jgi:type IV secretory pathway VirB6-like protein